MRALPTVARWYLIILWSTALVLSLAPLVVNPIYSNSNPEPELVPVLSALIFAIMLAVADRTAFHADNGRRASIAVAILIAGMTALKWPMLLLVIVLGTFSASIARSTPWWQTLAVIAVRALAFMIGTGIVWLTRLIDPSQPSGYNYTTVVTLVGLLCTGAIIYLIEQGAEMGLVATSEGRPLRASWRGRFEDLQWYTLVLAPLGGLLSILWLIDGLAFVLGTVPMIVVHRSFSNQVKLGMRNSEFEELAASSSALNNKLERLQSLATTLVATRDSRTMLETLCSRLAALLGASTGWVVLCNDKQSPLLVASYNLPIEPNGGRSEPVPWPQSYEPVFSRRKVVVVTDQRVQTMAPVAKLADGHFWNALIAIPLVAEDRALGAICLAFEELRGLDESEQRILAAFARQAAIVLENMRLFRQLQESQAELIQSSKLAAVGTFAAGIAHEFNNLLAGMLGYAQLGLAGDQIKEKNEALKIVVDTCKRGKSVTGSLLTFARRQEPRRELSDIIDAVQSTLTLMEIELRKCNITVIRRIQAVPPTICDIGQISQVFLNLLTNARDAMKPDGGELTVELFVDDNMIVLSVRDTGCGIPDSIRDKIFEPFVTTKGALGGSRTPGTGLGLSVSYGIVKEHSGAIEINSVSGQGTTVMIRLPIIGETLPDPVLEPLDRFNQPPPLHILVVDDDPTIGGFLQQLLQRTGHQIDVVDNALAALESYRQNRFDLVLTDLAMPGTNGVELVRALHALDADVTVLVFTGHAFEDQIEEALEAGAVSVLHKPFELEEVLNAIRLAWRGNESTTVLKAAQVNSDIPQVR